MKRWGKVVIAIGLIIGTFSMAYAEAPLKSTSVLDSKVPSKNTVEMKIYNALDKVQNKLVLKTQEFKGKDLTKIIENIAENYKFFYYKGFSYTIDNNIATIEFNYISEGNPLVKKKELDKAIQTIIQKNIKSSMSDYEKVKALHDYIVLNTAYDDENYVKDTIPEDSYNAYGALVNHRAVCQGYSEALNILCKEAGIDSYVIDGKMNDGECHAWNIVRIEGNTYHLDVTHDDPVPNVDGYVQYNYFLTTDEMMKNSRTWDTKKYPSCNTTKYNYFIYNDLLANSELDFIQRVKSAIENKKESILIACNNFDISISLLEKALSSADYNEQYTYIIDDESKLIKIYNLKY